jgi:hypothetical protein
MMDQLVMANALVNANSFGCAEWSAQTKTAATGLSADRGGFILQTEERGISSAG